MTCVVTEKKCHFVVLLVSEVTSLPTSVLRSLTMHQPKSNTLTPQTLPYKNPKANMAGEYVQNSPFHKQSSANLQGFGQHTFLANSPHRCWYCAHERDQPLRLVKWMKPIPSHPPPIGKGGELDQPPQPASHGFATLRQYKSCAAR